MGTAIKHPVPDRVKPPFLTSGHSDAQPWASEWRLNPVCHRMLYSCIPNCQQWASKG